MGDSIFVGESHLRMKRTQRISASLAATSLAAVGLLATSCATHMLEGRKVSCPSQVIQLNGDARYRRVDDAPWKAVKAGTVLLPGTLVQTAAASRLVLALDGRLEPLPITGSGKAALCAWKSRAFSLVTLRDNSVVRLDELTRRRLPSGDFTRATRLDLRTGSVFAQVRRLPVGSEYAIKFTSGGVRLREGSCRVNASGDVWVSKGRVLVVWSDRSRTNEVTAGQYFDSCTGQKKDIPTDIYYSPPVQPDIQLW